MSEAAIDAREYGLKTRAATHVTWRPIAFLFKMS